MLDQPCSECSDDDDVRMVAARGLADRGDHIALCGACRLGHHAFYDEVDREVEEDIEEN